MWYSARILMNNTWNTVVWHWQILKNYVISQDKKRLQHLGKNCELVIFGLWLWYGVFENLYNIWQLSH